MSVVCRGVLNVTAVRRREEILLPFLRRCHLMPGAPATRSESGSTTRQGFPPIQELAGGSPSVFLHPTCNFLCPGGSKTACKQSLEYLKHAPPRNGLSAMCITLAFRQIESHC